MRRLRNLINRRHEEDADCDLRPSRLAASASIDGIFRQGLESPLSYRSDEQVDVTDVEAETAAIQTSLRRLGEAVLGQGPEAQLTELKTA